MRRALSWRLRRNAAGASGSAWFHAVRTRESPANGSRFQVSALRFGSTIFVGTRGYDGGWEALVNHGWGHNGFPPHVAAGPGDSFVLTWRGQSDVSVKTEVGGTWSSHLGVDSFTSWPTRDPVVTGASDHVIVAWVQDGTLHAVDNQWDGATFTGWNQPATAVNSVGGVPAVIELVSGPSKTMLGWTNSSNVWAAFFEPGVGWGAPTNVASGGGNCLTGAFSTASASDSKFMISYDCGGFSAVVFDDPAWTSTLLTPGGDSASSSSDGLGFSVVYRAGTALGTHRYDGAWQTAMRVFSDTPTVDRHSLSNVFVPGTGYVSAWAEKDPSEAVHRVWSKVDY